MILNVCSAFRLKTTHKADEAVEQMRRSRGEVVPCLPERSSYFSFFTARKADVNCNENRGTDQDHFRSLE
jgi:hypothetical protein